MQIMLSETTTVPPLVPFAVELTDLTDKVEYIEGLTLVIVYAKNCRFVELISKNLFFRDFMCFFSTVSFF